MTTKDTKTKALAERKCDRCGRTIPPSLATGYATDYVWRDGQNLCHRCNAEVK